LTSQLSQQDRPDFNLNGQPGRPFGLPPVLSSASGGIASPTSWPVHVQFEQLLLLTFVNKAMGYWT
jgi:hypothetical protein